MEMAERIGGIAPEQFGSRKHKAVDLQALNTRLFYNYDMVHTCRTAFGDSTDSYGGDVWAIPCSPPPQGLGQGNSAAPCIWALVSTPILNALQKKGFSVAFKCCISESCFRLVGYCFVDNATIVQMALSPTTPVEDVIKKAQEEVYLHAGLARAT
eukprot:14852085-Ditylum_brightwellii.AAC.1